VTGPKSTLARAFAAFCFVAIALAGCDGQSARRQSAAAVTSIATSERLDRAGTSRKTSPGKVAAICDEGDGSVPTLVAIDALGSPSEQSRFSLSKPLSEFRIKLLNHFHLPRDAAETIWERTWASTDCRLTIWSVRAGQTWRPVDQLRWSRGDQF